MLVYTPVDEQGTCLGICERHCVCLLEKVVAKRSQSRGEKRLKKKISIDASSKFSGHAYVH